MTLTDQCELAAYGAGYTRDWSRLTLGAVSQSIPIVTAYDTLGEEGLTHSLQETNAIAIFLDGHLIKSIVKPLAKTRDVKVYLLKCSLTS
jgi:long-chain acyl-CoA synthetase